MNCEQCKKQTAGLCKECFERQNKWQCNECLTIFTGIGDEFCPQCEGTMSKIINTSSPKEERIVIDGKTHCDSCGANYTEEAELFKEIFVPSPKVASWYNNFTKWLEEKDRLDYEIERYVVDLIKEERALLIREIEKECRIIQNKCLVADGTIDGITAIHELLETIKSKYE